MSIELVFYSDTNQQLAQRALEDKHIEFTPGPDSLVLSRESLVAHLPAIEAVAADYNGHLWAD